jgi:ABC-type nitrate/sulfonate/bicarbonate transport system ATPase subunit
MQTLPANGEWASSVLVTSAAEVPDWLRSADDAPALRAERIRKSFARGGNREQPLLAIDDVTLHAAPGEIVSILGPSGCGKSTLFNILAGLLRPSTGAVRIGDTEVNGVSGLAGYMLQADLLLPWQTVIENATLGLRVQGVPKRQRRERAKELLTAFGLGDFIDEYPSRLSGGMRQRCAFARTLLFPRNLLLLDEPLGALDAQTRLLMQEWLLAVLEQVRKTVLLVTHDIDEALFMSDSVYVLSRRPAVVVDRIEVDLPRPRTPEVRESDRFTELRRHAFKQIREQSLLAMEQTAR